MVIFFKHKEKNNCNLTTVFFKPIFICTPYNFAVSTSFIYSADFVDTIQLVSGIKVFFYCVANCFLFLFFLCIM